MNIKTKEELLKKFISKLRTEGDLGSLEAKVVGLEREQALRVFVNDFGWDFRLPSKNNLDDEFINFMAREFLISWALSRYLVL